jgi:hypothetical protein
VDLFLDICQAAGIAAAVGIRPFLGVMLVGALATQDIAVNFSGTDYAFLESDWFLLAVVVALAIAAGLQRRLGFDRFENGPAGAAVAGLSIGMGAVQFAGSIADRHDNAWLGLVAGMVFAWIGLAASRVIFRRTARRLDPEAREALPVYAEGVGLALAGLSLLVPPISILAIAFLVWVLVTSRRREGEKYAGLRILR